MNHNWKQQTMFWLPGVLLFVYVLIRAIVIPVTHDESNTILTYAAYPVADIMLYTDPIPNNHILNTLLIKLLVAVFGLHSLVVRLPNVLGFLLYYIFLIRIIRKIQLPPLIGFACIILMTCNPYFLDFFSLARGYALACAFGMMAVFYAYCFITEKQQSFLIKSVIWSAVAVYTSFTFLNFYVALLFLFILVLIVNQKEKATSKYSDLKKPFIYMGLISLLLGVSIIIPIMRMLETEQFVFWGSKNFYDDTLLTLAKGSFYGKLFLGINYHVWCNIFIVIFSIVVTLGAYSLFRRKLKGLNDSFIFFLLLALGTVCVNICQFYLADTPYLTSRTALLFIPILTLPFIFLANAVQSKVWFWKLPFLIGASLLLGILFKNMNIEFTYEWWFDRDTFHVLNLLEQYHTSTGNNVSLNTNWLYYPSFNFHVQERNLEWLDLTQFHFDTDSLSTTDFYYIIDNEANKLNSNYRLYSAYGDYSRRLLIHR
ncbi:MAG: glycosyltransferase family 39 protein [Chitinophagales bacterium]